MTVQRAKSKAGFHVAEAAAIYVSRDISASKAKDAFAEIYDQALHGVVRISKRRHKPVVMLSEEDYLRMQAQLKSPLEALADDFDRLVAKMQTPEAARAANDLTAASTDALRDASAKGGDD